uniref:BTB domain-containing protein n=1 Tax=Aureoumbra lagunensis TaxID=44058 RepID=A0A7S3NPQ6_9STRA|mmetsp:Transcript_6407/g.8211  ORF Transcript_6407/g.8211 Transcript_6407/m.8211 type:complete len:552 (-) Transcript_6407:1267-2922(-)
MEDDDDIRGAVWDAYINQEKYGNDIEIKLNNGERKIKVNGAVLTWRANKLVTYIKRNEIDLSRLEVSKKGIKAVLDYVHGALDTDPPRKDMPRDFATLCEMLEAADFAGSISCKLWIQKVIMHVYLSSLDGESLRTLTELAQSKSADLLYSASSKELGNRAPKDVLAKSNPNILAELVVAKRSRQIQELALALENGNVLIIDAATGSELRCLQGHTQRVYCVAYTKNGSLLATGSADHTCRIYDAQASELLHIFRSHSDAVRALAFSNVEYNTKPILASASRDATVKLWDISNGSCLYSLAHSNGVNALAWAPSTQRLVTGAGVNASLWSFASGTCIRTFQGIQDVVLSLCYSHDGCALACGSYDNCIRLWDVISGVHIRTISEKISGPVWCLAFLPDGTLVSGSNKDGIQFWNALTGNRSKQIQTDEYDEFWAQAFSFSSHHGNILATSNYKQKSSTHQFACKLWDPITGSCLRTILATQKIYGIAFRQHYNFHQFEETIHNAAPPPTSSSPIIHSITTASSTPPSSSSPTTTPDIPTRNTRSRSSNCHH